MSLSQRETAKRFGRPKQIIVWENGDFYNDGHCIFINPNYYRTWNGILGLITDTLKPSFGAIRNLVHLNSKEIISSFENLLPNDKYVATGNEKLKEAKNAYKTAVEKQDVHHCRKYYLEHVPSTSGYTSKCRRTILFVMANGKADEMPCKVVLTESDIESWDTMLEYIARSLDIPEGIQFLYTVFGDVIQNPRDIQNGCIYVAVATAEKFIDLDYVRIFNTLLPMREINIERARHNYPEEVSSLPTHYPAASGHETGIVKSKSQCTADIKSNRMAKVPHSLNYDKPKTVGVKTPPRNKSAISSFENDVRIVQTNPLSSKIYANSASIGISTKTGGRRIRPQTIKRKCCCIKRSNQLDIDVDIIASNLLDEITEKVSSNEILPQLKYDDDIFKGHADLELISEERYPEEVSVSGYVPKHSIKSDDLLKKSSSSIKQTKENIGQEVFKASHETDTFSLNESLKEDFDAQVNLTSEPKMNEETSTESKTEQLSKVKITTGANFKIDIEIQVNLLSEFMIHKATSTSSISGPEVEFSFREQTKSKSRNKIHFQIEKDAMCVPETQKEPSLNQLDIPFFNNWESMNRESVKISSRSSLNKALQKTSPSSTTKSSEKSSSKCLDLNDSDIFKELEIIPLGSNTTKTKGLESVSSNRKPKGSKSSLSVLSRSTFDIHFDQSSSKDASRNQVSNTIGYCNFLCDTCCSKTATDSSLLKLKISSQQNLQNSNIVSAGALMKSDSSNNALKVSKSDNSNNKKSPSIKNPLSSSSKPISSDIRFNQSSTKNNLYCNHLCNVCCSKIVSNPSLKLKPSSKENSLNSSSEHDTNRSEELKKSCSDSSSDTTNRNTNKKSDGSQAKVSRSQNSSLKFKSSKESIKKSGVNSEAALSTGIEYFNSPINLAKDKNTSQNKKRSFSGPEAPPSIDPTLTQSSNSYCNNLCSVCCHKAAIDPSLLKSKVSSTENCLDTPNSVKLSHTSIKNKQSSSEVISVSAKMSSKNSLSKISSKMSSNDKTSDTQLEKISSKLQGLNISGEAESRNVRSSSPSIEPSHEEQSLKKSDSKKSKRSSESIITSQTNQSKDKSGEIIDIDAGKVSEDFAHYMSEETGEPIQLNTNERYCNTSCNFCCLSNNISTILEMPETVDENSKTIQDERSEYIKDDTLSNEKGNLTLENEIQTRNMVEEKGSQSNFVGLCMGSFLRNEKFIFRCLCVDKSCECKTDCKHFYQNKETQTESAIKNKSLMSIEENISM